MSSIPFHNSIFIETVYHYLLQIGIDKEEKCYWTGLERKEYNFFRVYLTYYINLGGFNLKRRITTDAWTLAFSIAFFPPIWAVLAPHINVRTGAVALICAGLYAANGNKRSQAFSTMVGFLLGDLWAVLALLLMEALPLPGDLELFVTLFLFGGLAVLISALAPKYIFCPAWLCGWAIGLTILSPAGVKEMGTLPVEIGVAMIAGIWYVGVFADMVQKKLVSYLKKNK